MLHRLPAVEKAPGAKKSKYGICRAAPYVMLKSGNCRHPPAELVLPPPKIDVVKMRKQALERSIPQNTPGPSGVPAAGTSAGGDGEDGGDFGGEQAGDGGGGSFLQSLLAEYHGAPSPSIHLDFIRDTEECTEAAGMFGIPKNPRIKKLLDKGLDISNIAADKDAGTLAPTNTLTGNTPAAGTPRYAREQGDMFCVRPK